MPSYRALRNVALNEMKKIQSKTSKKMFKKISSRIKDISLKNMVHGLNFDAIRTNIRGNSVTARFNYDKTVKIIEKALRESNEEFMSDVFLLSQKYVPIDKKYANAKRLKYLKRRVDREVFEFKNNKSYKFSLGSEYGLRTDRARYDDRRYDSILGAQKFAFFVREKGWYDEKEYNYIQEMFRGSNRRTAYGRTYYSSKTNTMHYRKHKRMSNTIDTGLELSKEPYKDISKIQKTNIQPSGGFKELKKGGKLTTDRNFISISYSAFDKTRPNSTFNYAKLQHDNMRFKHDYGRSLFLKSAFDEQRRKWANTVNKNIKKKLRRGTR